jgi:ABC-2 type transporter
VVTHCLTAIVEARKGAPTRGAVVVGNPILELYLTLAATAAVATLTGLALSAAARSHDQILPMLVISVMLSTVFCGGLIPVTGRPILDELSWAVPARWGFAATASTTDLRAIPPDAAERDPVVTPRRLVAAEHDRPYCFRRGPDRLHTLAHPAGRAVLDRPPQRQTTMVSGIAAPYSDAAPAVHA